uniref:Uncharacterized protein n=1 Tax=Ralstonia solanacearum TaxID=305 RepID=A0A0S4WDY3_RALSL|nr:protein of unknown function [Ralstonia solanacearum]
MSPTRQCCQPRKTMNDDEFIGQSLPEDRVKIALRRTVGIRWTIRRNHPGHDLLQPITVNLKLVFAISFYGRDNQPKSFTIASRTSSSDGADNLAKGIPNWRQTNSACRSSL